MATFDAHANFSVSTVATAPSPATSGTSLVVASGEGSRFPSPPFNATISPANTLVTSANSEIVRVTAISTDTLTITRAQELSSARTVVVGDQIAAAITSKTLTDIETAVNGISSGGVDFQKFTANGTWTKPTGAKVVKQRLVKEAESLAGSRECSREKLRRLSISRRRLTTSRVRRPSPCSGAGLHARRGEAS